MSNILETSNYKPPTQSTVINKDDLDNYAIKVGFIYIQLRGTQTPDEIFKTSGKWQDISSQYAGEFFRAVGRDSASFGSKQDEGLPNIEGRYGMRTTYEYTKLSGQSLSNTAITIYSRNNNGFYPSMARGCLGYCYNGTYYFNSGSIAATEELNFNASKSNAIYGASDHVTPYNSTVRIWKKIA